MTAKCNLCGDNHELPCSGLDPLEQLIPRLENTARAESAGQVQFALAVAIAHLVEQNRALKGRVERLESRWHGIAR